MVERAICRGCLIPEGCIKHDLIYSVDGTIANEIFKITNLIILDFSNNKCPAVLCQECSLHLQRAISFRKMIIKNDKYFRTLFSEGTTEKLEEYYGSMKTESNDEKITNISEERSCDSDDSNDDFKLEDFQWKESRNFEEPRRKKFKIEPAESFQEKNVKSASEFQSPRKAHQKIRSKVSKIDLNINFKANNQTQSHIKEEKFEFQSVELVEIHEKIEKKLNESQSTEKLSNTSSQSSKFQSFDQNCEKMKLSRNSSNFDQNIQKFIFESPKIEETRSNLTPSTSNFAKKSTISLQKVPRYQRSSSSESIDSCDSQTLKSELRTEESVISITYMGQDEPENQDIRMDNPDDDGRREECAICHKKFAKMLYLKQHMKSHTNWKHRCGVCGKKYETAEILIKHSLKHAADKPFKCGQCSKSFNYKYDMQRHEMTHSQKRPFPCAQCEKSFVRKDHLVKHEAVHNRDNIDRRKLCAPRTKIVRNFLK